jgi:hypothetical protein
MGAEFLLSRCQNGAAFAVNAAMSNDLTVQAVATPRTANDAFAEARTGVIQPPSPSPPAANHLPIPNPTVRFDPALELVVIEFYSAAGSVTTSVPSQRQLQEYRKWNVTHIGQNPAGAAETQAKVPATTEHGAKKVTAG